MYISKKILTISLIFHIFFSSEVFSQAAKDPIPTVKKMIGYIRYKKNDDALKMMDLQTFSQNLLKEDYATLTPDQKKQFEDAVKAYTVNKSFPIALSYFDKIDINYEKPIIEGKQATVPSSIMYKGSQKIQFSWILTENNGKFLVSDFLSNGKLASEQNRKQIEPIFKKKGFDELVKAINKAAN